MKQGDNKKTNKTLAEYQQSHPQQLLLFYNQTIGKHYSQSIELYDAIPKYYWGRSEREHGKYLPLLQRQFKHRGISYKVTITPARLLDSKGEEKEFLPGQREELVEDALRKLACDGQGVFLDNQAGVVFSLYELEKELQRMGHGYNKNQIKEALFICGATTIHVMSEDGNSIVLSHIFPAIGLQTQEDLKKKGPRTKAFVCFNPLVTKGIQSRTFRQINYEKCMAYRRVIARWLHKRLSHNYIQASHFHLYEILLSTIIWDSGMKQYKKLADNLREVKKALDEMIAAEVLAKYTVEKICGIPRNKIADVRLTLTPHRKFIQEMKLSNKRFAEIQTFQLAEPDTQETGEHYNPINNTEVSEKSGSGASKRRRNREEQNAKKSKTAKQETSKQGDPAVMAQVLEIIQQKLPLQSWVD